MKSFLIIICGIIISLSINAQDEPVYDAELPEAEFHVAINPTDTNNIVLATISGSRDVDGNHIVIYYTSDYGVTWNISDYHGVPDTVTYDGSGDPVLGFDNDGNVYFVNLSSQHQTNVNTLISKSEDGGATWTFIREVATGFTDKPWLAIDNHNDSPYKGNFYVQVVGNNIKMYTLDNELNETHIAVMPRGEHLPSVVTGSNGNVYCSGIGMGNPNEIFVMKSTDGGESFGDFVKVVSFPDYMFNAPNISTRFQPTAYLAIDNSGGTFNGRLYLSYTASEQVNPDYFDVFLTYSDDEGENWSSPMVVHSNHEEMIDQFYSSSYVNDEGILILDWYDRTNYNPGEKFTDFFMGISSDGGETFAEFQLNSVSSDFTHVIPASNDFGIGEYHQVVATENTAISFWSDGRSNDGDLNIYMAKVDIDNPTTGVNELGIVTERISISTLFPQPVTNVVNFNLSVKEKIKLSYRIINNNNGLMWESDWYIYTAGDHSYSVNCDFPPGIYHLMVISDKGFVKSMKFIKL
jgi:hypothetical protein